MSCRTSKPGCTGCGVTVRGRGRLPRGATPIALRGQHRTEGGWACRATHPRQGVRDQGAKLCPPVSSPTQDTQAPSLSGPVEGRPQEEAGPWGTWAPFRGPLSWEVRSRPALREGGKGVGKPGWAGRREGGTPRRARDVGGAPAPGTVWGWGLTQQEQMGDVERECRVQQEDRNDVI